MKIRGKLQNGKTAAGWLLLGLGVLMLLRSVLLCFSEDIWYDELFTVGMIEHPYGELVAFTAQDVHPPLYYCIVKLFCELCKLIVPSVGTVEAAKLASTIPYVILLIYSLTFIRKRFGIFVGGLFFFCLMAMPQLSAYTVEIRMYSFALYFVTAALLHAYGTLHAPDEKKRRLHGAALVLYGLAAAYTQYFALVAVVMVYFYALLRILSGKRERLREWFLWVAVSIACYAPWLMTLLRQVSAVSESYWIQPLTWRSLGGCVKFLLKPSFTNDLFNTIFAVALFCVYAVCFVLCLRKNAGRNGKWTEQFELAAAGIGILLGLILFGFVVSFLLRPVFVYRYMLSAMGGFWLCFVLCLDLLCDGKGRLRTALQIATVLFLLVIGLRDYRAFMGEEEYKALLMKDTQEALAEFGEDDVILYNFDQVQMVTAYYMENATECLWGGEPERLIQDILQTSCEITSLGDVEDAERISQIREWLAGGRRVWFVGSFNSRDEIVETMRSAGLTVEEKGSYFLERYWFNLYSIPF